MAFGIYYHGSSNDKLDDPNNRKMVPPSVDHPFFVSNDPSIAIRYAMMPSGNDGRLADVDKSQEHVYGNSRVYLVRIDLEKLKQFDIFSRRDVQKLSKFYSDDAINEMYSMFVSDDYTIMRLAIMMANALKMNTVSSIAFKAIYKMANSDDSKYRELLLNGLNENQKAELRQTYKSQKKSPPVFLFTFLDSLKYFLNKGLIDDSFFDIDTVDDNAKYYRYRSVSRRDIKNILFSQIHELGYNAVVERNTFYSNNRSKNELAIMDIAPIVDATSQSIKIDDLKNTIENFKKENKPKKEFLDYLLSEQYN